jgi:ribonuclease D
VTWIRTPEALGELCRDLESCRAIGLDTESDSLYHYRDKVCLLQLATDAGALYLVDSLAVDVAPLAEAFARSSLVKVLHGADYDVTTLKRDFGFRFEALFDTMIAARLLGKKELGLLAVARDELGVTLSKANQKDDWSRRPLTPEQEAYALADVAHLIALRERLAPRLEALGRLSWLEEECAAVAALEPLSRKRDKDAYLAVKGARRLGPRSLAALRELYTWREQHAEQTDIPAFRILGNESLLRLAELLPANERELGAVPGVLSRNRRLASALLEAVRRARELPESELPRLPRVARPAPSEACQRRVDALKAWRSRKSRELELDPAVILPQRLIERLAEGCPCDAQALCATPGLRRWRADAFGSELLAALS